MKRTTVLLILVFLGASWVGAASVFVGFGTESNWELLSVDAYQPSDRDLVLFDDVYLRYITQSVTIGVPAVPWIRGRAGVGFFFERPVSASLGLEVPIVERFNSFGMRGFGVYLFSDARIFFSADPIPPDVETSLNLLVPLSTIGGLSFGGGVNRRLDPFFKVCYLTGGYFGQP